MEIKKDSCFMDGKLNKAVIVATVAKFISKMVNYSMCIITLFFQHPK